MNTYIKLLAEALTKLSKDELKEVIMEGCASAGSSFKFLDDIEVAVHEVKYPNE